MSSNRIKEIIVVEGRDDTNAINRAVEADTIETHGFGIRKQTWDLLQKAYETRGLIIFTDPDKAGEDIRKRVLEAFPGSRETFLERRKAAKGGDIGIENASPGDIREALEKARCRTADDTYTGGVFDEADMERNGLTGTPDAKRKRETVGAKLGIGYGNSRAFLKKLNAYGITREEFDEALRESEEV